MLDLSIATLDDIELARRDSRRMVTKRALLSGAATLVPLPGTDVLADIGMLMKLIPKINERFGLAENQLEELNPDYKIMALDLARHFGAKIIGRLLTKELVLSLLKKVGIQLTLKSGAKFIPFLGQAAAVALGVAAMRYVGNSHIDECYRVASQFVVKRVDSAEISS